tara:strand:+ start:207 stop:335 length:129 start_codon:yes stop_codon:yes gene_type:complete
MFLCIVAQTFPIKNRKHIVGKLVLRFFFQVADLEGSVSRFMV